MMVEAENPLIFNRQAGDPGKPRGGAEGLRAVGQMVQIWVQVWRTGNSEGRRRSGSRFSTKQKDHETSLGCQQAGWCPPRWGGHPPNQVTNSHTAPLQKHPHRHTQESDIWASDALSDIWVSGGPVTLTHNMNHCKATHFVPSLLLLSSLLKLNFDHFWVELSKFLREVWGV